MKHITIIVLALAFAVSAFAQNNAIKEPLVVLSQRTIHPPSMTVAINYLWVDIKVPQGARKVGIALWVNGELYSQSRAASGRAYETFVWRVDRLSDSPPDSLVVFVDSKPVKVVDWIPEWGDR